MIKPIKHQPEKRSSFKALCVRVRYIADPNHKNHQNKIVLPSKNHDCLGDGPDDFIRGVENRIEKYYRRRKGMRGKRTQCKWREFIASSEEGVVQKADGAGMEPCLNAEEREEVEKKILAGPIGRGACRHGWHIDHETGRCDWHCLCAEHDEHGVVWVNDGFGKGQKNLKLELERAEEDLLRVLNRRRPPDRQLKTARQRHGENRRKAGNLTFAQKLVAGKWDGTPETLTAAAEQARYIVHSQTEKSITVHSIDFKKEPKIIRYSIVTLHENWAKEKAKLLQKKLLRKDDQKVTGLEM